MKTQPIITTKKLARLIASQIFPRASEADKLGRLPFDDLELIRTNNFHILSIPTEFGGYGLSLKDCIEVEIELAQGNASTAMVLGMHLQVFGHARDMNVWSKNNLERLSKLSVKMGALFNTAASEIDMGSPSRGGTFRTTAVRLENNLICINGEKTWVTGGKHLTHILVRAKLDNQPALILVKNHTKGVTWEQNWKKSFSLRASESDDVILDDVIVSENDIIDFGGNPITNVWFPLILAGIYLGCGIASRNRLIEYSQKRIPTALGKPISELPKIRRQLGEIDTILQAAEALLLQVAGEWQTTYTDPSLFLFRAVAAKEFTVKSAMQTTEMALSIVGGRSLSQNLPFERFFRDARAGLMQPPSGDTAYEIIGQHLVTLLGDESD